MLYLYHGNTSVCAVKVRIALEEKALAWSGETLDLFGRCDQHSPAFRSINPKGLIPVLKHDGRFLTESSIIIEYLDEAFEGPALMPEDPYGRARVRGWLKKVDEQLHTACTYASFAIAFRDGLLKLAPEQLEAFLSQKVDTEKSGLQRAAIELGIAAPHVVRSLQYYDTLLGEMEAALTMHPWLAGKGYSLADVAVTPYVNRAAALGLARLWARRPHVEDWFERVRERPSFGTAVTAWVTDADRQRYAIDTESVWAQVTAALGRA